MHVLRFPLSLRLVEDLLHERGVALNHQTLWSGWHRFGPLFAVPIKKRRIAGMKSSQWCWHLGGRRTTGQGAQVQLRRLERPVLGFRRMRSSQKCAAGKLASTLTLIRNAASHLEPIASSSARLSLRHEAIGQRGRHAASVSAVLRQLPTACRMRAAGPLSSRAQSRGFVLPLTCARFALI